MDDKGQSRERKEVIGYHFFVAEEKKLGVTLKKYQTCVALPSKGEALHTFPDFGGGGRSDPPAFIEDKRRGVFSPPMPFCSSPIQLLKECLCIPLQSSMLQGWAKKLTSA